ncbi:MAG: beta-lactamase family protein, partial [Tissierella sp.]|nr:beta-lactamase family protein [Tissierella sp.]
MQQVSTSSRIIEKISGEKLRDYLKDRLFDRFGYFNTQWETCPNGHTMGLDGLHLRTDEFAKVGQLLLQKGRWNEEQ